MNTNHPAAILTCCFASVVFFSGCKDQNMRKALLSVKTIKDRNEPKHRKKLDAIRNNFCDVDSNGLTIAKEEAAKLKKGQEVGMLRWTLTEILLCYPKDKSTIGLLKTLQKQAPSETMKEMLLMPWIMSKHLEHYPLHAQIIEHATYPFLTQHIIRLTRGPHDRDVNSKKQQAWCTTVAPTLLKRAQDTLKRPDNSTGSLFRLHTSLIKNGCKAGAKAWQDNLDNNALALEIYNTSYAHNVKAGTSPHISAAVAAQDELRLPTVHFFYGPKRKEHIKAKKEKIFALIKKRNHPTVNTTTYEAWQQTNMFRMNALWKTIVKETKSDPTFAHKLIDIYLSKKRSCTTHRGFMQHIAQKKHKSIADAMIKSKQLKPLLWQIATQCPRVMHRLDKQVSDFKNDNFDTLKQLMGKEKIEANIKRTDDNLHSK